MKKTILMIAFAGLMGVSMAQTESSAFVYVHRDQSPKPLNLKETVSRIEYPEYLLNSGKEGTVLFRVLVDEKGNYRKHETVRSETAAFAFAAERVLPRLKFEPAMLDGEAVSSWVFLPIRYEVGKQQPGTFARQ